MNILLAVVDSLRRDALSVYDPDRETPNIDRIADNCVTYNDFTASSCWTIPTHASMFTGLYPSRHSALYPNVHPSDEVPFISELVKLGGYDAHAINIPKLLSGESGFNRGWTTWQNTNRISKFRQAGRLLHSWVTRGLTNEPLEAIKPGYVNRLRWNYRSQHAVRDICKALNNSGDQFVFANFYSVHTDYRPLPRYTDTVREDAWKLGEVTRDGDGEYLMKRFIYLDLNESYPDDILEDVRELYQGGVRWVDDCLGDLWTEMTQSGLAEETAVLLTSDHGDLFGESDEIPLNHSHSLHPALIDVPLLLYHPEIDPGRNDSLHSQVDITPTILDMAGVTTDHTFDGVSLLSNDSHEVVFSEHGPHEPGEGLKLLESRWDADISPVEIDRKAARTQEATVRFRSDGSVREHNRTDVDKSVTVEQRQELRKLVEEQLDWISEGNREDPGQLNANARNRLEKFGYIT